MHQWRKHCKNRTKLLLCVDIIGLSTMTCGFSIHQRWFFNQIWCPIRGSVRPKLRSRKEKENRLPSIADLILHFKRKERDLWEKFSSYWCVKCRVVEVDGKWMFLDWVAPSFGHSSQIIFGKFGVRIAVLKDPNWEAVQKWMVVCLQLLSRFDLSS